MDQCSSAILVLSQEGFFNLLAGKVGSRRFVIEDYTARFNYGYLFVDGTWADHDQNCLLRAADLF